MKLSKQQVIWILILLALAVVAIAFLRQEAMDFAKVEQALP